ncbi:MAG TPA: sorbosone dehydrogenase family protein [Steroidobacteraceae bacterium]|nr:sorbosone dehydrogenase family protein [Steroidobacteraceae bacterium]
MRPYLLGILICSFTATAQNAPQEYGPHPVLPPPQKKLIPTLHIAKAKPWAGDAMPQPAAGTTVSALARGLKHPRWLYVLPDGDILVAESDAPPKPEDSKGISGKVHKLVMKRAGSGTNPSADEITLLRDKEGNGLHVERHIFLSGLHSPIGMALIGNELYVADTDAVVAVPYTSGETESHATPRTIVELPAGPINHHWTKSLVASPDGKHLFVGVGSNSNAGENGIAAEAERNAVWEIDPKTGQHRIFASGLRNPVGLAWQPESGALWVSVNERDELGDHLPPDYMTALHDGAFYGFPYSYFGNHVDKRVRTQNPQLVAKAMVPDYALGAHTASLGLCWSGHSTLPLPFRHGMFVGQHGSWNRKTYSGYKVIFVPFKGATPAGMPIDVLSHFLDSKNVAHGRPVGLAIDKQGSLLVADDVGNTVWRVSAAHP